MQRQVAVTGFDLASLISPQTTTTVQFSTDLLGPHRTNETLPDDGSAHFYRNAFGLPLVSRAPDHDGPEVEQQTGPVEA